MTQEKQDRSKDRRLGMDQPITRRDFLNGIAIGATAAVSAPLFAGAAPTSGAAPLPPPAQDALGYYPPLLTGMRGSHPGSFEDAHALRDGGTWPPPWDTGEEYDLIVVGGGISGLAAAHYYRAHTNAKSRILILDNHDDFGGHAKRNEFNLEGHLNLLNGGTLEIDSPRPYGPIAADLLTTLGIDVAKLIKTTQNLEFYEHLGLQSGVFFDQETFGADKLVVGLDTVPYKQLLADAPLSAAARDTIERIQEGKIDYMPGLSSDEKKQRLSRMSYQEFLRDLVHAEPSVLDFYRARTHGEWGVGIDAVSAGDCWAFGFPGFQGMNIAKGSIRRMGFTAAGYQDTGGSLRLHLPDGNATIARLLVRNLIPSAVPGSSVEDVVTARVNYAQLDRSETPVRLRLNSIAIRARHLGDPRSADQVEVTYLRGGHPFTARARGVVLAGYNMMIPYLCPELPAAQKDALHQLVKTPLVYTSVALRNRRAFDALKVSRVYAPGGYHAYFHLNRTSTSALIAVRSRRMIRCSCTWCAPPANQGCPNMIRIASAGRNYSAPRSRPSSATSAISLSAPWVPEDSIPLAILLPSPSIAGRTAMRRNTTRCSIRMCPRSSERTSSVACTLVVLQSPIPIPAGAHIRILR